MRSQISLHNDTNHYEVKTFSLSVNDAIRCLTKNDILQKYRI